MTYTCYAMLGGLVRMIKKRRVKLLQPCKLFRGGEGFKEGTKGKVELLIEPLEPHVRGGEVLYAPSCPWWNAVDRRCYQSVQAEIVDQRLKEDGQLGRLDQVVRAIPYCREELCSQGKIIFRYPTVETDGQI